MLKGVYAYGSKLLVFGGATGYGGTYVDTNVRYLLSEDVLFIPSSDKALSYAMLCSKTASENQARRLKAAYNNLESGGHTLLLGVAFDEHGIYEVLRPNRSDDLDTPLILMPKEMSRPYCVGSDFLDTSTLKELELIFSLAYNDGAPLEADDFLEKYRMHHSASADRYTKIYSHAELLTMLKEAREVLAV